MPIDASIYQGLRPVKAPSMMDSATRAMNLSQMATQQERMGKQMEREDLAAKQQGFQQKISALGGAVDRLAGMPEEQRAQAYPMVREQLVQGGLIRPEDAPEQYDTGWFRTAASNILPAYQQSDEYLNRQYKQAQIGKLKAEAERGYQDPLARQMAMLDAREQYAQRKEDEKLKRYSNVGGWKLSEGATPTLDDAKKFKAGAASARTLLNNLNEFQSLIDKHGGEVMPGKVKTRLNSLARDIQLSAKNEDLYGLGVLTGPDLMLLEDLVDAPTGLWENLNPWAGDLSQTKAQQFRDLINTRMSAKAKTFGFEPTKEWQSIAAGTSSDGRNGSANDAYAAPPPKQGQEEDGYVYMGGDPANPKSWKRAR